MVKEFNFPRNRELQVVLFIKKDKIYYLRFYLFIVIIIILLYKIINNIRFNLLPNYFNYLLN